MTRLYFEAHITATPLGDFNIFAEWLDSRGWKASKFDIDNVDGEDGNWFGSARSPDKTFLLGQVIGINQALTGQITRWKIEETVWDSKCGDTLESALEESRNG